MISADEERARAMRSRAAEWPVDRAAVEAAFPQPWRGYGLLARIVFFLLTCAGIGAFYGLTRAELLTAALCIGLAEFLIGVRRWFGTGVEEALWLGGVLSAIAALPSSGRPESNLVIAAAIGLAGFRVRNPLFGAAAMYFVTRYPEAVGDLGTIAALVVATASLFALYRTWKRPSTELLFVFLAILMPFAAWMHADARWLPITIGLYAVFSAVALLSAILKRHHAMFAAAAAGLFIMIVNLHDYLRLREELTLGAAGAVLLAGSWLVGRLLRDRTRGLVVTPAKATAYDGDLRSVATFAVVVPSAGNPPEGRSEGGGGFGGAGATGDL